MSILSVENLSFGFGDKTLLKNISFNLFKGDHAGLVGVNGTGKTLKIFNNTGAMLCKRQKTLFAAKCFKSKMLLCCKTSQHYFLS